MAENLFRDFEGAEIWQNFKRSKCGKLSECKICKKIIKCDGGSTKGLHVHLKTIHHIEILKRTSSETISKSIVNITGKLDLFINDASLSAVLARMTACDGLSFNIFVTSFDLRKSLSALGHSLPKSGLVNKVRKIVKIFRRSPLKNEILQHYVKEVYPNGLNLILNCKTRWSSLLDMLERIVRIKVPVQKALLDLQEMPNLSNQEFTDISIISFSLSPIKAAIEALCRRDANLIVAEATIKFLLEDYKVLLHILMRKSRKLLKNALYRSVI